MSNITVHFSQWQLNSARHDLGEFAGDIDAMVARGIEADEARAVESTFLGAAPGFVTFPAKFAPVLIESFEARIAREAGPEQAEYRAIIAQCVARIKVAAGLE